MSITSVPPLAPAPPAPLASIPRRLLGFLLDVALVAVLGLGVWWLEHGGHLAGLFPVPYPRVQNVAIPLLHVLVLAVVPMVAGRTPGMAVLGMRVRDAADRGRVGFLRQLVRAVLLPVDLIALGLVGLVVMWRTPQRQRTGDVVAQTVVVRTVRAG
ncbi:RDD family protein [Actinomycetospora soli]|uniref:RDD family protein n=1 Tax=Actinomycetospora soli TaxID=2893887 RepID=UPI001E3E484E|nr:RDD family protein [Actinomycetospora soli]MCD2187411.1 RDD family protein [Actinomycetospora soli]